MKLAGIAAKMFVSIAVLGSSTNVGAATLQSLYSFGGGNDGTGPYAPLVDVGGVFYGTTTYGGGGGCSEFGGAGCGVIYKFDPVMKTETIAYAFQGGSDGEYPQGPMININGILYGTTVYGGNAGCEGAGCGVVFQFDPASGAEKVLYTFQGGAGDGGNPQGTLLYYGGKLYGAASVGAGTGCFQSYGCGAVYDVDPATGAETLLHVFKGAPDDGSNPADGLVSYRGNLYGTTYRGGAGTGCVEGYGCGTAYKINPTTGHEGVLHSFSSGGPDGASPQSAFTIVDGVFYGTTNLDGAGGCGGPYGCGTLFSIDPKTGNVTPLHQFTGGSDGQHPVSPVINFRGSLYGAAGQVLFSYNIGTGVEAPLYSFSGGDGSGPIGGFLEFKGSLYSTTHAGGTSNLGTVYKLKP